MRYFVFLRILERDISNLLDIAIYTLNPHDKWGAHVTLAGPYDSPRNLPRHRDFHQKVSVLGVGQFRSDDQNTVFLKIGASDLKSVWDKPDYPYNPHLTIYDGRDNQIGDRLYEKLQEVRPFLTFHTSRLEIVSSQPGQPTLPLIPPVEIKRAYRLPVQHLKDAWALSAVEKVDLAVMAIQRAKNYNLYNDKGGF